MCGIVGIFLKNPKLEPKLGTMLSGMLGVMCDRGPDSAGFAVYGSGDSGHLKLTLRSTTRSLDDMAKTLSSSLGVSIKGTARDTHLVISFPAELEPERFAKDFAIWDRKLDNGRAAPRNGKVWDAFKDLHAERTILTADEGETAQAIAKAVRFDETANKYLALGDPEASLQWEIDGRPCKGRVDWITTMDGSPVLVGLKTTRDCRLFAFGSQAAKLDYAIQWSWYADGYERITGKIPRMIEIVVESAPPFAVGTYIIWFQ